MTVSPEPSELSEKGQEILARRGIKPASIPAEHADPAALVLAGKLEQLGAAIGDRIGTRFVFAETDNPAALAWAQAFLVDPATAGNLLLLGPTGTGKTHLAAALIRRVASARAQTIGRPLRWRALSHPQFNADMRPSPDGAHNAQMAACQATDLLFLDDVGAGMSTDWTADTLYRLADVRWSRQRPTIAASNLIPTELRAFAGQRVWERLTDEATVVTLTGASRRARRGAGA